MMGLEIWFYIRLFFLGGLLFLVLIFVFFNIFGNKTKK